VDRDDLHGAQGIDRRDRDYHARVDASRPIGVFDSGVGGLTVLHECLVTLPNEDFVYVGDTGRFPYGQHSLEALREFATEITCWLEAQDVKLVVVACNSATAAALPTLQRRFQLPIIGVITPESRKAVRATRARRVGVLGSLPTVESGRYSEVIGELDAGVEVIEVACPGLADRIQDGNPYDEAMVEHVREVCAPLRAADVDTVILGCTHYPLVRPMLQRELGRGVTLVSAAEEIAQEVAETLILKGLARDDARRGEYHFACTGDPDAFARTGQRFLQLPLGPVRRLAFSELAAA
jgi:glutamate racemase